MMLFNQIDFSGGLDAEFDRLKSPTNSYPLLINGRVRDGVISPTRRHLQDDSLPIGTYQDLRVLGDFLLVFISGVIYYRNISTDGPWLTITGWTALNSTAEIHTKVMPFTVNTFNRTGTPDEVDREFNPFIAQTPQCLYITNSLEQPRALFVNGTWRVLNTYAQWSMSNSEYVPLCYIPQVAGTKAYYVSVDKKKIYPSVSGRYFDCVINIVTDGNKGGDADTTALAVDFNDITSIHEVSDGGLLVTTLYAAYLCLPDGTLLFGEPVLKPTLAFPVGAVNQYSFADLIGDTAFISPSGIQSFNVVRQINNESNNFPISKKISRYLAASQTDTCATNFDDYALFAIDTTFGRAVAVFDTVRQQFVSLDTGFGTVRRFAVYKKAGITKLFFINTDNHLYEAYSDATFNTARVLLGDYSVLQGGAMVQHNVTDIYTAFTGITSPTAVRMSYYSDEELVAAIDGTLSAQTVVPPPPVLVPFPSRLSTSNLAWGVPARIGYKTSTFIEWTGAAKLVGLTVAGSAKTTQEKGVTAVIPAESYAIAILGEPGLHNLVATHVTATEISGLTVGSKYYMSGAANLGSRVVTDAAFIAKMQYATITGSLYAVDDLVTVMTAVQLNRPDALFTLGNVTNGTEASYQRALSILGAHFEGPAGNLDIDSSLPWYQRHLRYGVYASPLVDIFVISGGWNSVNDDPSALGASSEIDGVTSTDAQALWLKYRLSISTAVYKLVLVHYPPFSDLGNYLPLRWPFREWGVNAVISAHTKGYERFYVDGLHYVVCGTGGNGFDAVSGDEATKTINDTLGYLLLTASSMSLHIEFKDTSNLTLDGVTIYS